MQKLGQKLLETFLTSNGPDYGNLAYKHVAMRDINLAARSPSGTETPKVKTTCSEHSAWGGDYHGDNANQYGSNTMS